MPQFGEIKKFILFLYKGQKTDILLVGQKEMFCDPYENETFISFEDSDLKINWKGVAKRGKGNIPPGEMKIRVLLSNDSKEYLESISQLFNTKKMSLDAIVKLHTENDYQRVSTNTKIEKDEATNCEDANVEGQCGESDDDKDAKDNGDMDEEDDPRELVTTDKNQNVLPINQRSAVRKRQAPSRLNLEATQINVYEDLTTSKKAKPSSKQQKEIMSIAHKTASDRILSLDQLNDSFDDATTENGEKGHSSPQGKDMLDSTLAKILVECTNTPLGKQSPVSVGRKDNSLKRADCGSSCCQEKDAIIGELKLEIKFQKDLNKTFSMQTTVLTDVRELLLKFSSQQLISTPSQQLAPPSTSNSGNFLNYANQSSTSGNLTGHPKFVGGNCAQMPNSEMSDKIGSDSLGDTLSTIEDESDGQLYDHKSFPIPETVMRRLIKGPVTHFVSHLMDKLYTDQYLATHKMTDMGGSGVGSKRLAMNKHELQHIIDRVLDCGLVNLDGSLVNEKMVKNAISRKFNNSRAK